MKIVYCMNVSTEAHEQKLAVSVGHINSMFENCSIFVASNGISKLSGDVPQNVYFKKWGGNQGWQLGGLNGVLQGLRFAAESVKDADCPVITSHEDIYPVNKSRICELFDLLDEYDLVCRKYTGTAHVISPSEEYPYYMIDDMIFSPRVLKLFEKLEPVGELHPNRCAEEMFGHIVTGMGLKVKTIPIRQNSEMVENEMGFFHNHVH